MQLEKFILLTTWPELWWNLQHCDREHQIPRVVCRDIIHTLGQNYYCEKSEHFFLFFGHCNLLFWPTTAHTKWLVSFWHLLAWLISLPTQTLDDSLKNPVIIYQVFESVEQQQCTYHRGAGQTEITGILLGAYIHANDTATQKGGECPPCIKMGTRKHWLAEEDTAKCFVCEKLCYTSALMQTRVWYFPVKNSMSLVAPNTV